MRIAGTFYDVPALVPSNVLRSPSYRQNAYSKAALIYDVLQDMLGVEVFKTALRGYINEWNGKHPSPYDFFNIMSSSSGKELNWFWKKWFMEFLKPDLAIKKTSIDNSILSITVSNEGGLPLPVELNIIQSNGKTINIHKSAEIWKEGNSEVVISENVESEIKSITLGSKYIPDVNPKDNTTE